MTGSSWSAAAPVAVDAARHTPGPWAWFGNQHSFYLASARGGRKWVMGFERYGMRSAQPTFCVGNILVPAMDIAQFAVGDPAVRGFAAAKADPSVYRYDIRGIDAPDARLIAASPDLLAALKYARNLIGPDEVIDATIAQAEGGRS